MRKRMSENGSRVSKESGGRAAVNRLPPLALSSVLSIAVILGQGPQELQTEDI